MISPNNGLNVAVGPNAVIPGSYDTGVTHAITGQNQVMMKLAENFDPFIQRSVISQPHYWYKVIPRGAMQLFQGLVHETRIFRGGLQHYAGLSSWYGIDPVPSNTNNPAVGPGYDTPSYAWERQEWSGFIKYWGSDPINLNTLKYTQEARTQLGWILQVGMEYGVSLQEVWNRDYLIKLANDRGRTLIMTRDYVGNSSAPRFFYDPFVKFGTGEGEVNPATGVTGPFIVFPTDTEVEPLNFDVLDVLHQDLDVNCPQTALSGSGGENMFGLPVSRWDFEKYLRGNKEQLQNWRYATMGGGMELIEGLGLKVKDHRGWAMAFDENQLRFKIVRYIADYDSTQFGGVGADLDGLAVTVAQYVPPRIPGRYGENGQRIPEPNPEYFTAQLAVMPTIQKNIFTNLMGTKITDLGSGTYFGPQAGLNGVWNWINIPHKDTNPEGLIGNFLGKYEIFPKPDPAAQFATALLYRRCTEPLRSLAPVDNADINPDAASGAIKALSYTASGVRVDDETVTVSAALANTLMSAGPGTPVELKFTRGQDTDTFQGYVTVALKTYQFGGVNIAGLVAAPVADVASYYVDAGVLKYHAADNSVTELALSTVEAK